MTEWDYIIVGAGSAGCVLANRLSADPQLSVLVLEAGGTDASPYVQVPAGIVKLIGNPRFDWCHRSEPDPTRGNKVELWPAGRTLGGSSSINGMLYVRGARHDFDHWARLGNSGWSFDDVLPHFKSLEATAFGSEEYRGRDGPLAVSALRTAHPLAAVFHAAARECGLSANSDYNGADQAGVSEPQVTQYNGRRMSAARAFLHPVRARRNLQVLTHAVAQRLVFAQRRCVGVDVLLAHGRQTFAARHEVLLACGSLGSPKLLLLSGIGAGERLQPLGIEVRADRDEVGANLREHADTPVCAHVNVRTYNTEINGPRIAWHALNWLLRRRGPATSPYPHAVAFFRSRPDEPHPDLQLLFGPFAFGVSEQGVVPYRHPAISCVVNACHPESRGELTLRDPNPQTAPLIRHAMFEHPEDMRRQIAGCRFARQLLAAAAFAPYATQEYLPGPGVETQEQWAQSVRSNSFLGYHPVGTCRMGRDINAVVNPRLEVQGVNGLRVVDASVMPWHISANTNAATLMIAEKAAHMIRAKH